MLLTVDSVGPYLVETGVLDRGAVVENRVVIEDVSRRNRAFRVIVDGDDGMFVKQAGFQDPERVRGIATEADWLQRVHGEEGLQKLRWFTPRLLRADAENDLLVTELVQPTVSVTKLP